MKHTDANAPAGMLGRFGAWLRGDRYMVDAHAPRAAALPAAPDNAARHDEAADIHDRNAELLDRHGATSDADRERRDAAVQREAATSQRGS